MTRRTNGETILAWMLFNALYGTHFQINARGGKIKSTLSIARLEISTGALAALETAREVVFRVSTEEFHVPVTDPLGGRAQKLLSLTVK
jgi:hypothetical protein